MTTDSLTEEQAKSAIDFIARKLGYDYVVLEDHDCRLVKAVKSEFALAPSLVFVSEDRRVHIVYASSFKKVLEQVSGHLCVTIGDRSFLCPKSLEELLVMMDMEA